MDVKSVSLNNAGAFTGNKAKYNVKFPSFSKEEYLAGLQRFVDYDDAQLRAIAIKNASNTPNIKKARKVRNFMYAMIPVSAGIASAMRGNMSRISRVGAFLGGAFSWIFPFAVADAVFGAASKFVKPGTKTGESVKKHPLLTTIAAMAASCGVLFAGYKGIGKLLNTKFVKNASTKFLEPVVDKLAKKLDASKILSKASGLIKKLPSSAKGVAGTIASATPWALMGGILFNSARQSAVKDIQANRIYQTLKTAQVKAAEVLAQNENEAEVV